MTAAPYHRIAGALALLHSEPDGDSIRFHPHHPRGLAPLADAGALAIARDGSVQLRLEGIDAPELHYRGAEQPLARRARDELLAACGFDVLHYRHDRVTVREAIPPLVPAVIFAKACDPHGRPIAYLFTKSDADDVPAHLHDDASEAILRRSINADLLRTGAVFPLLYDTQPEAHREVFRVLAAHALRLGQGVWPRNRTAEGLPLAPVARRPARPSSGPSCSAASSTTSPRATTATTARSSIGSTTPSAAAPRTTRSASTTARPYACARCCSSAIDTSVSSRISST